MVVGMLLMMMLMIMVMMIVIDGQINKQTDNGDSPASP